MNIDKRLELLNFIQHNKPITIINSSDWKDISNDYILTYHLIREGNFPFLDKIPLHMFQDYTLALSVFRSADPNLKLVPEKYLHDSLFILNVLENNYYNITIIPEKYWNKEDIIEWFCFRYSALQPLKFLPIEYRDNLSICKSLLQNISSNYSYFSDNLKNNIELYELVIQHTELLHIFPLAGINIRSNQQLASHAVYISPHMFQFIGDNLKNNVPFFLDCLHHHDILEYSSESIRDNEQCVWESIKKNALNIQYASDRLLNLPSFCLQICEEAKPTFISHIFKHCGIEVRSNQEIIKQFLPYLLEHKTFQYISLELRNDYQFMLETSLLDIEALHDLGDDLITNSKFFIDVYVAIGKSSSLGELSIRKNKQEHIFDFIKKDASNNVYFILDLYEYFGQFFISSIYPKISKHSGNFISLMNNATLNRNGLYNFLEKLKLKNVLIDKFDKEKRNKTEPIKKIIKI